jgi:hypothetical protein
VPPTPSGGAPAIAPPCLLVNPRSFRASRRNRAARVMRMAREAGILAHEVTDPASLHTRLAALRAEGVEQIWVFSGDGTILALAEYLAERAPDWSPALLLLAGGRANVVPRDVGGYPALPALRRALAAWCAGRALPEEQIVTLRVVQQGQPDRHGFVWAGGLVYEAVRLTAEHRAAGRGWWRHSLLADPCVLIRWALRSLLFGAAPAAPQVSARLAGVGELAGPMRALVASSLAMRNALYQPFAPRGAGPVRFTALTTAAPSLWRLAPAILRGRFGPRMDPAHGVLSGRGDAVHLQGIGAYALDGELFSVDPALPLVLSAGRPLRVLRPVA